METQAQAVQPLLRQPRKSRDRCAMCRRATGAGELLFFMFCPSCYAIIYSEIEAAIAREEAPEAASRIEAETILMPCVIADRVVQELSRFLGVDLDTGDHELANKLVERAERIYEANPRFRRSMKLTSGRDDLYMWMRHWLSGEVSDCRPDLSRRIPDDFKRGLEIRTANTGQEEEAPGGGNVEEATALGNPEAASRKISPRPGKAVGEHARAGVGKPLTGSARFGESGCNLEKGHEANA